MSNDDNDKERIEAMMREALGEMDEILTLDRDGSFTVDVPYERLTHTAFALWVGELNANQLREMETDNAAETLRRDIINHLQDLADDGDEDAEAALKMLKVKMVSYGEYFKMESKSGHMAAFGPGDVPDHVREYLEEQSDGRGIGAVDMDDPDMPEEVREWFEEYLREQGVIGGDDTETSELGGGNPNIGFM